MAKKNTRGFYLFEDGYYCWVNGMSGDEKRREIRIHGKIIRFTPTNQKGDKKMIYDYLFYDTETGEEFFVECETKEEAITTARTYFERPFLRGIFSPEDADILGYDTY